MDTRTGEIRSLTPSEPLRPTEVGITAAEAHRLEAVAAMERMAMLNAMRAAKPKTQAERTSGMPRRNGDNPSRGKKKGRRA